jgi:hypothetical protein
MKRIFLSVILAVSFLPLAAQRLEYFLFIQETSGQPFYVRIGEDNHSSSAGGHLLLAPLKDSVYNLYVGFAKSSYPEQLFTVPLNRKDRGFELKNINGSWQLSDLQTLELLKPAAAADRDTNTVKKTDSYSNLMAALVDDTAVLYRNAVKEEVVIRKDSLQSAEVIAPVAVVKKDTLKSVQPVTKAKKKKGTKELEKAAEKNEVVIKDSVPAGPVESSLEGTRKTDTLVQAAVAVAPEMKTSVRDKRDIIRYSTENVTGGRMIIYLDRTGEITDTIRIIIPRL